MESDTSDPNLDLEDIISNQKREVSSDALLEEKGEFNSDIVSSSTFTDGEENSTLTVSNKKSDRTDDDEDKDLPFVQRKYAHEGTYSFLH
jgi:hypothetical protein